MAVPVKDTGYSWVVLVASTLVGLLMSCSFSTSGVYLVEFIDYFQVEKVRLGWVGACQMTMLGFAGIFAGPIAKAYGCRVLVSLGTVLLAIGYISSAFTDNLYVLYFTVGIITGSGFGFYCAAAPVAVQVYFDKRRSTAGGIVVAGNSLGTFIWPPLVAWLIEVYTWRGAMFIQAAIFLNGFVLAGLLRPFPQEHALHGTQDKNRDSFANKTDCPGPTDNERVHFEEKHSPRDTTTTTCHRFLDISLLKDPPFLLYCLGVFCMQLGHLGTYAFLPLRGVSLGASKQQAALLASILGVCSGVGRVCFGLIGDMVSHHRPLWSGVTMLATGTLSALSVFLPSYPWLAGYATAYSLIGSCYTSFFFTLIVDILGLAHVAHGTGIALVFLGACNIVLYPVSGALIDATDNASYPFVFFGFSLVVGGIMHCTVHYLLRKRQRSFTHS